MPSHIASLRGWHPALARAEIAALLPNAVVQRMTSRRLVRIDAELTGQEMKEAVLCSSGCQALLEHAVVWQKTESIDSLVERMAEYIDSHTRTGTVAVRSWKHDGKMEGVSARELVRKIGGLLSRKGYSIDLDNPNHKLSLIHI